VRAQDWRRPSKAGAHRQKGDQYQAGERSATRYSRGVPHMRTIHAEAPEGSNYLSPLHL
jgi:hypothetical protein